MVHDLRVPFAKVRINFHLAKLLASFLFYLSILEKSSIIAVDFC